MKIKMVQMFIPGQKKDYLKLASVSKEINQKYCNLHGYDYQFVQLKQEQIINQLGGFSWNQMAAYKQKFMLDHLTDCDYMVWIDADAAVSNPNIKIEDLIDDKHDFFLSRGNDQFLQNFIFNTLYDKIHDLLFHDNRLSTDFFDEKMLKQYDLFQYLETYSSSCIQFNQGLYIIKNSPIMHQFLEQSWYVVKAYFLDCAWSSFSAPDGRAIRFLLLQNRYEGIYTYLFDQAQCGIANIGKTKYNVEKTFVLHNWGDATTIEQKIQLLEQLKQNKWWKGYFNE